MSLDVVNGEPSPVLVLDEKLSLLFLGHNFFSLKQNETSFIRDQYCHLADDDSPLVFSTCSKTLAGIL